MPVVVPPDAIAARATPAARLRLHPVGSVHRAEIEAFIAAVYRERYGAQLRHFAPVLVSLHDEPGEIPTWPDRSERRVIGDGLVFTVEPFLSLGGRIAIDAGLQKNQTLVLDPPASLRDGDRVRLSDN